MTNENTVLDRGSRIYVNINVEVDENVENDDVNDQRYNY